MIPTHHRYTLPTREGEVDLLAAGLWRGGAIGVWERPGELVAWFDAITDDVPPGGRWQVEPDRDWQAAWKATISPVRAGRIVIVPTWSIGDHVARPGDVTLVLDPGRAFGSGHHATTTQCLDHLQALDLVGARVLDVGCGSGILAIAAARLGAHEVVAIDLDPDAVAVTRQNAASNTAAVVARVGTIPTPGGPYDVVLANLVTDTIVGLADGLVASTRPGGSLIVSGIAVARRPRVEGALVAAGCDIAATGSHGGWAALTAQRPVRPGGHRRDPAGSAR